MLTWMGFIGKLIEFMATKLIGKRLDLALDEKKKACKTFLSFLDSLSQLESLFGEFVKYVESLVAGKHSHIYRVHLVSIVSKLNDASKEFLKNLEKLGQVVYLYDPNLTLLFSRILYAKSGLAFAASEFFNPFSDEHKTQSETDGMNAEDIKRAVMRFNWFTVDNPNFRGLEFTMPSEELMKLDLNEMIDRDVRDESRDLAPSTFPGFDIESADVLLALVSDKYIEKEIGPDDIDILIDLYPTFKAHQDILRQARESLRAFIRKNFSLEDLLYVIN